MLRIPFAFLEGPFETPTANGQAALTAVFHGYVRESLLHRIQRFVTQ